MFPPAKIDELRPAKNSPGQLMVSLMEERGQIKPNDISPLLTALDELGLHGLLSNLHDIIPGSEESADCLAERQFKTNVGNGCYNELITIGILIEEDILKINDKPGWRGFCYPANDCCQILSQIFAEWYAANYLSTVAGSFSSLARNIKEINPVDLQFVFRFACGLNKKASSRIIKYLKGMEDGQSFASLCFFEQVGKADEVVAMVKDLCTGGVTIRSTDSKLLQRSTIQILDIAAKGDVSISYTTITNDIL
ncbi:hypothetical protein BSL78_21683 [Apostichopus japonicus]|uniref:Uncharacterized protein n=1 Tax=Stichopus japonicus TaxID=307972 RepID=A0A2G8K0E6_STIJA|nr:hypothetical protein BSL78_21683 [Apostichopus japonicus]